MVSRSLWLPLSCVLCALIVTTPSAAAQEPPSSMLELFPSRDASGTAWVPDATPMEGVHASAGAWRVMIHGTIFGQYIFEPGDVHRTGLSLIHISEPTRPY